jgi:hypothetical protein
MNMNCRENGEHVGITIYSSLKPANLKEIFTLNSETKFASFGNHL